MDTAGLAALAALLLGFAAGAGLIALLLRGRLRQGQAAQADLVRLQARLDAAGVAEEERRALLEATQRELSSSFRALSAEALDRGANRFLELADARMRESGAHAAGELDARKAAVEALVSPLRETLSRVEGQLRELETARTSAYSALTQQVNEARLSSEQLRTQTAALVQALRAPQTRGRWGELQLRRVVEIAGMSDRCDFDEQVTITTEDGQVRPDMIVRLAGGKQVVVDAKVSLAAYLEAAEATDDKVRTDRLAAHARHLRTHVDSLAA
ncbi:MAG: DNA recombination protein RmuC, partial [Mycobacteriales bacterium]